MKRILLALTVTAACAATLPPSEDARDVIASTSADDPCGAEPAGPDACGGAPLCSVRDRVQIACELRRAVQARYVFLDVKPRLLAGEGKAFDPRAHLDACVEGERAIRVEEEPLRFYDRMRRCTAAFEDGHLIPRVPGGLPQVALGVDLRLAGGKVYVASREPRLAAALAARGGASLLEPGTEVLEIDGRPVADALAEVARHVPAGSRAARDERAVDALTRRDFAYPDRPTVTLTLARDGVRGELVLPWWSAPGAERHAIAGGWVRRTGIATTDALDWRTDPRARWGGEPRADGARRGDPIFPPAEASGLAEYAGDGGGIAARLGEGSAGGSRFCYAQLLTFHTETLERAGEEKRPLEAVVEEFVRGCNARRLDLVLDLRQNEGGYLSYSTALAAMLLPRDGIAPGGALLVRATAFNERVYRQRAPAPVRVRLPWRSGSAPEDVLDAILSARRERREFTRAFLDGEVRASEAVGGFDGRVVALVSPGCMSACERLAGLLRSGGHATLVGGATEGAGGSQQEAKDHLARWTDRSGRLSVSIPNAAMGLRPAADDGDTSAARFFEALAFENRPVEPHVRYATTLEDLTGYGRGWRAQAEAALRAPAITSAATTTSAAR